MTRRYPSAKEVAKLNKRGRYAVGENVYLQISEWGTKAWVFRYRVNGKARHMGLGPYDLLSLAEAREKGHAARRLLKIDGVDPLTAKRERATADKLASSRAKTFKQCTLDCIAAHEDTWRGKASRTQWLREFERHVFPKVGDTPIGVIDVTAVLSVLDPIAREIPTVSRRVKTNMARVLDWAAARELRTHDNPAKRSNLLPKRRRKVEHFAALPYTALPSFMVELHQRSELSARALELAILTAARPNEVIGARWSEINMAEAIWTVDGDRMKSGRPHRVPLSGRTVELLASLPREGEYLFVGRFPGSKMDTSAMGTLLKRMGHNVTAHGMRSAFKTWASERTNFAREIIEAALAHIIGDAAEQSYMRGDALARRRQLMESWSEYVSKPDTANGIVVPLRKEVPA
jgi:integrase